MMGSKLLFVDDRWQEEQALLAHLPKEIEVVYEAIGANALKHLHADSTIRTVLLDLQFEGQSKQGEQIFHEIKDQFPEIPIIILTSVTDVEVALRLLLHEKKAKKAWNYFLKGNIDEDQLRATIEAAIGYYELKTDSLRRTDKGLIVGRSPQIEQMLKLAAKAARTSSTVLIRGDTGTGKELLARSIHLNSSRKDKPYKAINCASIPSELIENELFGHERGGFSGAGERNIGLIEAANGGTLFLDEIGELSLDAQAKLLRFLQEREIKRVGGNQTRRVDVRVLAATHRDLQEMVTNGKFREDLFYRVNVLPILVPALREHREDVPDLITHFLEELNNQHQTNKELSSEAIALFQRYDWPGNIRQLRSALERAVVLSDRQTLTPEDFPDLSSQSPRSSGQNLASLWVEKVFSGEACWKDINAEFKGTGDTLREVFSGIIKRWINDNGERPSGNELAKLLRTNSNHVRQVLNQVELKLRDFDG